MDVAILLMVYLAGCFAIAVFMDFYCHKIPNWLVLLTLLVGVIGHIGVDQFAGLFFSVGGFVTGLLCFIPFYLFGRMGAGDVKLLAAVGAIIGPSLVTISALSTVVLGGLFALIFIALKGGLPAMFSRYGSMFVLLVAKQPQYIPPAPGEAAGLRFPYALAIACGTAAALLGF